MSLTPYQQDALKEVINIGVGRAAASLSELISMHIELSVPRVALCRAAALSEAPLPLALGDSPAIVIAQDFEGRISGRAALVFPRECGLRLAGLLAGLDGPDGVAADELDLDSSGILTEVANIVLNGVLGSLANVMGATLTFGLPWFSGEYERASLTGFLASRAGRRAEGLVIADAEFRVRQRAVRCTLVLVFEAAEIESVLRALCAEAGA